MPSTPLIPCGHDKFIAIADTYHGQCLIGHKCPSATFLTTAGAKESDYGFNTEEMPAEAFNGCVNRQRVYVDPPEATEGKLVTLATVLTPKES